MALRVLARARLGPSWGDAHFSGMSLGSGLGLGLDLGSGLRLASARLAPFDNLVIAIRRCKCASEINLFATN